MGLFSSEFTYNPETHVVLSKKEVDDYNEKTRKNDQALIDLEARHKREREDILHAHKLEISQKDFDMKHLADTRIKTLEDKVVELNQIVSVLKKENEMLDKIVDVNKGLIDVKELVNSLIKKLPEFNVSNLTVNAAPSAK